MLLVVSIVVLVVIAVIIIIVLSKDKDDSKNSRKRTDGLLLGDGRDNSLRRDGLQWYKIWNNEPFNGYNMSYYIQVKYDELLPEYNSYAIMKVVHTIPADYSEYIGELNAIPSPFILSAYYNYLTSPTGIESVWMGFEVRPYGGVDHYANTFFSLDNEKDRVSTTMISGTRQIPEDESIGGAPLPLDFYPIPSTFDDYTKIVLVPTVFHNMPNYGDSVEIYFNHVDGAPRWPGWKNQGDACHFSRAGCD